MLGSPGLQAGEIVAPPGTAPALADRLSQAIGDILHMPEMTRRLREFGATPIGSAGGERRRYQA